MKGAALTLAAFCVVGCAMRPAGSEEKTPVYAVSLVDLLTNAKKHEGTSVQVAGYFGKDMRLYLTKEHAEASDSMSSLLISDTNEGAIHGSSCVTSWVTITGQFVAFDPGSYGLRSVTSIRKSKGTGPCFGAAS